MVENTLVIGLGMIGGSLAKALKENGFSRKVVAYDSSVEALKIGVKLGVIDSGCTDIGMAVRQASVIILAVPVKATASVLKMIKPHLQPECIISDVGSTKGSVIKAAEAVFGTVPANFVPAHPIAGSEKSGVEAANSQLFAKHKVIITPHAQASAKAALTIARMWQSTGAEVLQMQVEKHDEVLAATSHLPHLLAFSLVDSLAKESQSLDIFRYAAGGFRDFTRIAASDPTMWSDVCGANKSAILQQIDIFTQGLANLKQAIVDEDEQSIKGIFIRAREAREHFGKMLTGTAYAADSENKNVTFELQPGGCLSGEITVPGDKSISHRAIIMAALAEGISHLDGFLQSEDSMATVQAFRDMGVVIEGPHKGAVKIYGVGLHGLCPPPGMLYLGNSGTSMRLLSGLLAAQKFDSVISGDQSLNNRPMERVAAPLRAMGANIRTSANGSAPLYIKGGQKIQAIDYQMPMASAQVKSSILLAALYAEQSSSIQQPAATRDHTEVLMSALGLDLQVQGNKVTIIPGNQIAGFSLSIPGDISSAAFFIVGAVISKGSKICIRDVGVNPTRLGFIHILKLMGADIQLSNQRENNGEAIADINVCYSPLQGIDIGEEYVSIAIDEFPVLFIAASCASGKTQIAGLGELRHKESDRISVMVEGLREFGINIEEQQEGVVIQGGQIQGGKVDSRGDHRISMAFSIAALVSSAEISIGNCAQVATSFPEFVEQSARAGIRIRKEETNVSK
ncbi:MAG: bifunctional prephenate dehydrogenase/3-phosphoshikimate 1-carboxyvinyltransferase [Pseudomonadales bacterium]|nr:bifunctional prephenate dehydrogenase/3-phosphoshikimate 1-carboxyvinyltransferase [Pseudomonadales bacterium]NRA17300.1 bifunctional prephenate dehydrogenase/3-phosphoshikimate 1-carboxyvinyltransferase [Oceanospirillaceae bacterium]